MKATRCTQSARVTRSADRRLHVVFSLFMLMFSFNTVAACAQETVHGPDYTSIVVFGDSLSDTGNVAHLTQAKYGIRIPGTAADYTDGRFTDGADTEPPAQNFFGVWIEQYAATLPSKPEVKNSLDGGTNYAYGFATTGGGTGEFTFGPSDELFVDVNNIGEQITTYLATHPKIDDKTLFVVWGGAIDVLYATSSDDVVDSAVHQAVNIQRLIDAGATEFIVPNLPPLGLVPRLNGSTATSVPATEASALYNEVLRQSLAGLRDFNPRRRLQLSQLDVYALFNKVVASPSIYSLVNVTASSQGEPVDPDTYLFWDDLHPTTRGHRILAETAAKVIARSHCGDGDDREFADWHSPCEREFESDSTVAPR
jgi:phospholipase/lecithinase/hemolysin